MGIRNFQSKVNSHLLSRHRLDKESIVIENIANLPRLCLRFYEFLVISQLSECRKIGGQMPILQLYN